MRELWKINNYFVFCRGHFEPMSDLNAPYFQLTFRPDFSLQTSHKCPCSYPVQIRVSNCTSNCPTTFSRMLIYTNTKQIEHLVLFTHYMCINCHAHITHPVVLHVCGHSECQGEWVSWYLCAVPHQPDHGFCWALKVELKQKSSSSAVESVKCHKSLSWWLWKFFWSLCCLSPV